MTKLLCPHATTAQVLIHEIVFKAEVEPGISLHSIRGPGGGGGASSAGTTSGKALVIHKYPILPEGLDASKPIDISQVSRFKGQPVSVPCFGPLCVQWCAVHDQPKCASGCPDCQLAIMTKAFTSALEAQGNSLGLAAASRLLNKAHEGYKEEPQETPA